MTEKSDKRDGFTSAALEMLQNAEFHLRKIQKVDLNSDVGHLLNAMKSLKSAVEVLAKR